MKIKKYILLLKDKIQKFKINNNNKIKISKTFKIKQKIWKKYFHTRTILNNINKSIQKQPNKKIKNLYSLLKREDFILDAFTNLIKTKNFISSQIDVLTVDIFLKKNVMNIYKKIINKKYIFSVVNYINIEKLKKKKQIIIPNYSNLIVQEMIRMILEAIYEPIYKPPNKDKELNNYFRLNKSPHDAIKELKQNSQKMEFCLEGKIVEAYSNVHHKKLTQILKEKIKDKKFIKLIKQVLKCGVMQEIQYYDTLLKISQKRIISFMLFNIYMSKFDEYIKKKIQNVTLDGTKLKTLKIKIYTKITNKIVNKKQKINRLIKAEKSEKIINWKEKNKIQYKILKKEIKQLKEKKIVKSCPNKKKKN